MRKLIAISLGLSLLTGCNPELLKSLLQTPGTSTTQPAGQQPNGQQPNGQQPNGQQPNGQPAPQQSGMPPSGQPGMQSPPPQHHDFPSECVDKYKAMDTDGDGFVSKEEWAAAGHSEADFDTTDRNKDGKVDLIDFCDKPADQPPPSGEPSAEPSAEPTPEPTATPENSES